MARSLLLVGAVVVLGALGALATCGREPAREAGEPAHKAGPPARTAGAPAAPPGATPLASKPFYRVDAPLPPACTVGATCEATLVLTALGAYHVNKDYPVKFIGEPAPAVALEGDAAFAVDDAKHATLTLRFTPTAAGPATLAGVFKLSVCSDETCEIERPKIELAIAVR